VIREKGRYMGWLLILEKPFRKKSLALPVRAITGIWLGNKHLTGNLREIVFQFLLLMGN
jgi:hypothetical protein